MRHFLTLFFLFATLVVTAQSSFLKHYGGPIIPEPLAPLPGHQRFTCLIQKNETILIGGTLAASSTWPPTNYAMTIVEVDLNGSFIQQYVMDFDEVDRIIMPMSILWAGDYIYICGAVGLPNLAVSPNNYDINLTTSVGFVLKYNIISGLVEWCSRPSDEYNAVSSFLDMAFLDNGDLLICGQKDYRIDPTSEDAILYEVDDATGNLTQRVICRPVDDDLVAGVSSDTYFSLQIDTETDNSIYCTGRFELRPDNYLDHMRPVMMTFASDYTPVVQDYYLVPNESPARLYNLDGIRVADDYIQITTGDLEDDGTPQEDLIVMRSELNGDLIWANQYDFPQELDGQLHSVKFETTKIGLIVNQRYIVWGSAYNAATLPRFGKPFLLTLNADGTVFNCRNYRGILASTNLCPNSMIVVDHPGKVPDEVYAVGYFRGGTVEKGALLHASNTSGDVGLCDGVLNPTVVDISYQNEFDFDLPVYEDITTPNIVTQLGGGFTESLAECSAREADEFLYSVDCHNYIFQNGLQTTFYYCEADVIGDEFLTVYNNLGQLILEQKIAGGENILDFEFPVGLYHLIVESQNVNYETLTVVIGK